MSKCPLIIPVNKPARITSQKAVSLFKKNLNFDFGKIGHFGTLDPFASGLLLLGINGASKLNDYIHEYCPKTYLAVGKLGVHTDCLDHTQEITKRDTSQFFYEELPKLNLEFLNEKVREKFLGSYLQSPQFYSASKFQGRPLYEWARQGVLVQKEEKIREILDLKIIKYSFPYVIFEATVSSGTFIRTLFKDIANYLGTYGILIALTRTQIGHINYKQALNKKEWPQIGQRNLDFQKCIQVDQMLPLDYSLVDQTQFQMLKNGRILLLNLIKMQTTSDSLSKELVWLKFENQIFGMGKIIEDSLRVEFNFPF